MIMVKSDNFAVERQPLMTVFCTQNQYAIKPHFL